MDAKVQTKHISDELVCRHVAAATDKIKSATLGRQWWSFVNNALEEIIAETGCCEKVALSAMRRACGRCLIEYGGSIRNAWITEEGKALLALHEARQIAASIPHAAPMIKTQGRL